MLSSNQASMRAEGMRRGWTPPGAWTQRRLRCSCSLSRPLRSSAALMVTPVLLVLGKHYTHPFVHPAGCQTAGCQGLDDSLERSNKNEANWTLRRGGTWLRAGRIGRVGQGGRWRAAARAAAPLRRALLRAGAADGAACHCQQRCCRAARRGAAWCAASMHLSL